MVDIEFLDGRSRQRLYYQEDEEYYVIEQYKWWFVRIKHQTDVVKIAVKVADGTFEELIWDVSVSGYVLRKKKKHEKEYVLGGVGLLTLYDIANPKAARPLKPSLYVGPNNMPESEFAAILERLGQLAVAQASGLLAPITLAQQSGEKKDGKGRQNPFTKAGDSFLDLVKSLKDNWPNIKRMPAKEIKFVPETLDITHPRNQRTVRSVYQTIRNPGKRKLQILSHQENYDTLENRFLTYVIRNIVLRRAQPIAAVFRKQAETLRSLYSSKPSSVQGIAYENLWLERKGSTEQQAAALEVTADEIEKSAKPLKTYLSEPLLQNVQIDTFHLSQTLTKISTSTEYGPVYRAYQEYIGHQNDQHDHKRTKLLFALEEQAVRPAPELYEIWSFLEIYAMLVNKFGFIPQGNNPLDLAEVEYGKVVLEKGSRYDLAFTPKNGQWAQPLCRISLTYSPTIVPPPCRPPKICYSSVCKSLPCYEEIQITKNWADGLTPDILMTATTPAYSKRFALDAKYRNYDKQRYGYSEKRERFEVESVFDLDLLVTAKMKYLNGLGMDASFILHSDPNPKYTFFGSEPLESVPHKEELLDTVFNPAHSIGAIFVSPGNLRNLDKMLRCFLMYHSNLTDICWNCQLQLTEQNEGKNREKKAQWQGDYFQCIECGRFWIRQVCGKGHKLIKLGHDSFHKTALNEWQCICPACGNAPSFGRR